jgi:hypothetical protein
MPGTPSSQTRKRKSVATSGEETSSKAESPAAAESASPSKKRPSRGRKKDTVINLDVDDPFSFDAKADTHPEPLKNISVERTAFGGVKFSRSPPSSSGRYANLEKMAERRGNISGISSSTPRSSLLGSGAQPELSSNSRTSRSNTPKAKATKKRATESSNETYQMEEDDDNEESTIQKKATPKTPHDTTTPKRRSRSSAFTEAAASIYESKKSKADDMYQVPQLTPKEQLDVDHAIEEHQLLSPGARVMALWNHEFYAAIICGRDGLSRYFVHFVEDNLNRCLPPTGVIPLAMLSAGHQVSHIASVDGEEIGKTAEIIGVPSGEVAEEWLQAQFEVRDIEADDVEAESTRIPWEKIYLTKEQSTKIIAKPVNTTVFIDKENIVTESRSSRRSRTTRFPTEALTPSQSAATPQETSSSKRGVSRASGTRTPKTPASLANESASVESPKTTSSGRRGRGKGMQSAAKQTTPKATSKEPEQMEMDEEQKVEQESEFIKTENEQAKPTENLSEKFINEPETNSKSTSENEEPIQDKVESSTTGHKSNENGNVDLSFDIDQLNGSEVSLDESKADEKTPKATTNNVSTSQNGSPTKFVNDVSMDAIGSLTSDDTTPIAEPEKVIADSSVQSVAASSTTADNQEQLSKVPIFANMKFVLTSATRTKKISDFNKKDYRIKIEDRGGQMIDDFTSLKEGDKAFLVADTYYRTHKYLSALSLSVPCVKHNWIQECVAQEKLLDYVKFMLPAGESTLNSSQIFAW